MTTRKLNMIKKRSGYANYPRTFATIIEAIPDSLIDTLTVKQIVTLIDCLNKQYQKGKFAAGAEIMDSNPNDGAVFVNCLNGSVWWKKEGDTLKCEFHKG